MKKMWKRLLPLALALSLLAGCAQGTVTLGDAASSDEGLENLEGAYLDQVVIEEFDIEDEAVALAGAPAALNDMLLPAISARGFWAAITVLSRAHTYYMTRRAAIIICSYPMAGWRERVVIRSAYSALRQLMEIT